jgi:hypothetical protein
MNSQTNNTPSMPQDQKTVQPAALVTALAFMALLLVVIALRLQPPAAKGTDAPADQFSAGRVHGLLKEILAEGEPHWTGSEANQVVRQRVVAILERLGYVVEVQTEMACLHPTGAWTTCAEVHNIIARLPGQESGPALMLAAHYDSVPAGPGAADDGMAVAGLLEMARILKEDGSHRNPIVFLLTDGEEAGLLGAEAFVSKHPLAQDVAVVLNQESRGNSGQSFMFETSEGNGWLVAAYAASVPRPASSSLHYEIYRVMPNNSDLTIFRQGGMAGLNFAFIGRVSNYHTPLDNYEILNLNSVQHQGESVLAVARELAGVDLNSPPTGNVAWTDLLGFAVVRWPASWNVPLAVLALFLLLAVAVKLIRERTITPGGVLLGLLSAFFCLLAAVLLGMGLIWIVSLVSGDSYPYYAHPLPLRVSLWAAGLLSGGLIATAMARRCGAWGLAVGGWLLWALLGLLMAVILPGAAIMFLLPTFVAGLVFAAAAFTKLSTVGRAREVAFVTAALSAAFIWLSLSLTFETAVGMAMSPAITLGLGLVAGTIGPLFAMPQGRTRVRRWLLILSAVTVVLAAGVASVVPPYSPADPQQVNLWHFDDRDRGEAYWAAASFQGAVPEPLSDRFDPEPVAIAPWMNQPFSVTSAPSTSAPAPTLQVISEERVSGERVVTAQLHSPRGADATFLLLPVERLASIDIEDYVLPVSSQSDQVTLYSLKCQGRPCDGLQLRLHLKGDSPIEVLVFDATFDLPPGGEVFFQARPATALPVHEGDQTIILSRLEL